MGAAAQDTNPRGEGTTAQQTGPAAQEHVDETARPKKMHRFRVLDRTAWLEGRGPAPFPRIVGKRIVQGLNWPNAVRTPAFWSSAALVLVVIGIWAFVAVKVVAQFTTNPQPYTDSRYQFQVRDITGFIPLVSVEDVKAPCLGVILRTTDCTSSEPVPCAQIQICLLGFTDQQTLASALITRTQEITKSLLSEVQPGLIRESTIGRDQYLSQDVTLYGQWSGKAVKWHEVVLEFEGRLYAVEDVCGLDECARYEAAFIRIRDGLTFTQGVVRAMR